MSIHLPDIKDSQRASIKWILNNLQDVESCRIVSLHPPSPTQATRVFHSFCFTTVYNNTKGIVELTIELIFNCETLNLVVVLPWLPQPFQNCSDSWQQLGPFFLFLLFRLLGGLGCLWAPLSTTNSSIRRCLWDHLGESSFPTECPCPDGWIAQT